MIKKKYQSDGRPYKALMDSYTRGVERRYSRACVLRLYDTITTFETSADAKHTRERNNLYNVNTRQYTTLQTIVFFFNESRGLLRRLE